MAAPREPKKQISLPADIYDTLELAALVHGGVGRRRDFYRKYVGAYYKDLLEKPCCIYGLAQWACGESYGAISDALLLAGIFRGDNDDHVRKLSRGGKISFAAWRKSFNLIRGA